MNFRENSSSPALPHDPDDPENIYLRNNSCKKTYAEVIQDANMLEARYGVGEEDNEELPNQEETVEQQTQNEDIQLGTEDEHTDETWEIQLTPELKNQLAGPWKTSVILKIMGRPLGYWALQTRLAGIWRPTGMTHLIDLGYRYFIMRFVVLKDYQHALMDGPWFVGDNYLHVQAWEADFHPQTAKISTTEAGA